VVGIQQETMNQQQKEYNGMSIPLNTYSVGDVIDFLKRIKELPIKGMATSPPYNKAFNGRGKNLVPIGRTVN